MSAADTLDPAKTAGKIVVCERGVGARVDKSAEVKRAGGVGMVLLNLFDQDALGDSHVVPTVHLNVPAALTVKAYAAQAVGQLSSFLATRSGLPVSPTRRWPTSRRVGRLRRAMAIC